MGSYNFSLRDDEDDELTASLLEDPTIRAASLSSKPTGTSTPRSEVWTPDIAPRDPKLTQQWKDAESSQLQRSQYNPNDYGLGEFARDNGGLLLAGIVGALAGDKGRSLPSLANTAAETNRYFENQRRADAKNAGDFALKARAQKSSDLQDQLNIKRIQNQDRTLAQQDERIELATQGEGRRGHEFDRKYDPSNPQVVALKDSIVEASGGRVKREALDGLDSGGLQQMAHLYNLQYDSANTPQKARDEAVVAGATSSASANARNRSDVAYAPALGAAKGVGEARGEEITRPGKVATAGAVRTATEDAADASGQSGKSEKFQTDFAEKNEKLLRARAGLSAVTQRTGSGIPEGLDFQTRATNAIPGGGNFISDTASLNIQDLESAANSVMRDDSGAVIGVKEGAKGMMDALGSPTLSAEKKWLAVQNFQRRLDDQLRGKASRGEDAQAVIERQGITDLDVTNPKTSRRSGNARALPPPGSVVTGSPDRSSEGGMQTYTFKGPGGTPFTKPMTSAQVQTFVNANPDWQVY